ncbi:MAG TPA: hypothetical protein VNA25_22235 [Phycisphaerae bacterium]|nr:hypothetical protein [Phycisphaerae bacterium]
MFATEVPPWMRLGDFARAMSDMDRIDDSTLEGVEARHKKYEEMVQRQDYLFNRLRADAWCAAFVWKKVNDPERPYPITQGLFRRLEESPYKIGSDHRAEIQRLAREYQFFHWHLAFPEVFGPAANGKAVNGEQRIANGKESHSPFAARYSPSSGFDVVLGNPPWERVKLQEKEWFAERSPEIANAPNAAARKQLIEALKAGDPGLYRQFLDDSRWAEGESHLMRNSGRYPLCGRGDINVYTVFAEGMRNLLNDRGRVGCVLPTGIATDDTTKFFFQDVVEKKSLASLFDFENKGIFPGVHSSYKFCLFTLRSPNSLFPTSLTPSSFVFFAHAVEDLRDPERRFSLSPEDIALLNPNTRTCPIFRSRRDAELTKAIYRRVPVLIREALDGQPEENPWVLKIRRVFDMNKPEVLGLCSQQHPQATEKGEWVPMLESKLVHQFDHRFASYVSEGATDLTDETKRDSIVGVEPRFWIPRREVSEKLGQLWDRGWLLAWRDISNTTNERTAIAVAIPFTGTDFTLRVGFPSVEPIRTRALLIANWNAMPFDYCARQLMGGTHLSDYITKQLPVITPDAHREPCPWDGRQKETQVWLLPRILELAYTAWDLEPFAQDCGWSGPPFRWDEERRFLLRCELDAAFFHLYLPAEANGEWKTANGEMDKHGNPLAIRHSLLAAFPTPRDAVDYIMETFPIVKKKDIKAHGAYRTKDAILEIYDAMAEAIATGQPYHTRLDPPPGPPADAEGNFIPMAQWDPAAWPPHIHPPRDQG